MFEALCIAEAARQIRGRSLTPLDLVERCLEQIRRYEERVHAWVLVDEEGARRAAAELQRREARGPLYGIPLGIKDIIDVAGLPTRAGSPLRENHLAPADAPVVAALREAGAIILGKTVTVQFACFDPSPTLNPWDPAFRSAPVRAQTCPTPGAEPPRQGPIARPAPSYTPGGSSSGSAVAVAVGMCLAALGTQTGGSLVRPASYCGVATCKPTFGRIDTEGIVPVSYHLDHPGPMARTVGDLEIVLQHLLGAEQFQPATRSAPPRLGLVEEFFMEGADAAVGEVVRSAVARLREAGAAVEPISCGIDFAEIAPLHRRIMAVEAAAYHREQFAAHRQAYGPLITALLDEGLGISAVDYAAALAHQRGCRGRMDAMFAQYSNNVDALIMPSTDTTAPATLVTTGIPKFQAPWSYAGVPAVAIPCGLAGDGMPVGLQLVGRRACDAALLGVARWCEQRLAFKELPPLLA
jgi:Asp-tRNA(Asn)/Glu-tRNA(Gln) amidotransferase A subunit family amidase